MPIDNKQTNIADAQYLFLKVLCELYDGENYVPESKIREVWPECPTAKIIMQLGVGDYFRCYPAASENSYCPKREGIEAFRKWKDSTHTASDLQKLRQDFEEHRADDAAYKTAQEHRFKLEFWKNIGVSAASALLTATAANVIAAHWSDIVSFISRAVHLLPSLFQGPR